jgi:hypothetical protein
MKSLTWNALANRTRRNPLFSGHPKIKRANGTIYLRAERSRLMRGTAALLIGSFFAGLVWLHGREFAAPLITIPLVGLFAAVIISNGIMSLLMRYEIFWSQEEKTIQITRSFTLFQRSLEILKNDISARMYVDSGKGSPANTGRTVVSLSSSREPDEIILTRGSGNQSVQSLFELLKETLGGNTDETLMAFCLPDVQTINISMQPIAKMSASFSYMKLTTPDSDVITLKPMKMARMFFGAFLLMGGLVFAMAIYSIGDGQFLSLSLPFVIGILFMVVGICGLIGRLGMATYTFDRQEDAIRIQAGLLPGSREKILCRMQDVAAVQICSKFIDGETAYMAFEINLVLQNPELRRINLLAHSKEMEIRSDARMLANFIGVSVIE